MEIITVGLLVLPGNVEEIIFEGCLRPTAEYHYVRDESCVNGLPNFFLDVRENVPLGSSQYCEERMMDNGVSRDICFKNFTPGSVVAFRLVSLCACVHMFVGTCVCM